MRGQPYPDHSEAMLYMHGPDGDGATFHDLMTDAVAHEAMELGEGYGQRLHLAQERASRYNLISFLALAPHLWPYVKLAIGFARPPVERRREIRQWLKEAREMRLRMIAASKREAARLARVV